jgi:carboxypeptidase Q
MSILNASNYSNQVFTADIEDLHPRGVPIFANLINDTEDSHYYFKYHHSAGDTMNVIDPD